MPDNEEIHALLNMVHSKSEVIVKRDAKYEQFRKAVAWAEEKGLIRDLTQKETQRRMDNREWRKVNKIIIQNEKQDD